MNTTNATAAQTIDRIIADEKAATQKWAAETMHMGHTVQFLRDIFNGVCDPANWKLPVRVECRGIALAETVKTAVEFMAGGPTTIFHKENGVYVVENAGYYANIGA